MGSHVLREFISNGIDCVVLDNLSRGYRGRVPDQLEFIEGDAADSELIIKMCREYEITSILHFAAYMQARESVRNPMIYWENNLSATLGIAKALGSLNIEQLIFSSSCSVYGHNPEAETTSKLAPMSPYAMTKVACEQILSQVCLENQIRLSIMRYFNVIGSGNFDLSMDASAETLVPSVLRALTSHTPVQIYGDDFDTFDGTPLRDYLDVRDLARAHLAASQITSGVSPAVYNVSSGLGTTVKQIIETLLKITDSEIDLEFHASKPGDPGIIAAKPSKVLLDFGWRTEIPIETSLSDAATSFKRHHVEKVPTIEPKE